tara:strand:+ start:2914 stop:3270 length:357 start_codon:yes stop_codon:yes gene_type:complete
LIAHVNEKYFKNVTASNHCPNCNMQLGFWQVMLSGSRKPMPCDKCGFWILKHDNKAIILGGLMAFLGLRLVFGLSWTSPILLAMAVISVAGIYYFNRKMLRIIAAPPELMDKSKSGKS